MDVMKHTNIRKGLSQSNDGINFLAKVVTDVSRQFI